MRGVREGLTLEEFLRLPERKPALEFVDGVVTQKPWPGARHSVQTALMSHVNEYAERNRLALAFPELSCLFAGSLCVPDVAVFRWERIPRDPNGRIADDYGGTPDIAMEVVSPKQSVNSLIRRCLWYLKHGVHIALLVDPEDHSVVRFYGAAQPTVLRGTDRIDLDGILPGFRLTADELFVSLRVD